MFVEILVLHEFNALFLVLLRSYMIDTVEIDFSRGEGQLYHYKLEIYME